MNKSVLTEADIRTKFITPAITEIAKWDVMTQVREEAYFTSGRVIVRGKVIARGVAKKADYLLYYKPNLPIAVVEAKDNTHSVGAGMQQALAYAEILDVPFAYCTAVSGIPCIKYDGGRCDRRDDRRMGRAPWGGGPARAGGDHLPDWR